MRILAIDDDTSIRELLPMVLAASGYEDVVVAPSGAVALDMIEAADPAFECLLIDIQMPGMDGVELCRRVRQIPDYAATPIIMLTAMTQRSYIDRAFAAGATDYVTKPFETLELGVRVRNAEELVKARRAAAEASTAAPLAERQAPGASSLGRAHDAQIGDPGELIDLPALENYLRQLSRAGLLGSQIIAIKVSNIDDIYSRASVEELHYALTEVADAIADSLGGQGFLMARAGNGLFICASNNPSLIDPIELEGDIQAVLDDKQSAYDDGLPMDIEVSVGMPLRPGSQTSSDPDTMLNRAVARAEKRALDKQKPDVRVNIRPLGRQD